MAKVITVTIADGKVTADAEGYKGKGCAETIDQLLAPLGKKVSSGHKPEFHQTQKQEVQQKVRR